MSSPVQFLVERIPSSVTVQRQEIREKQGHGFNQHLKYNVYGTEFPDWLKSMNKTHLTSTGNQRFLKQQ